MKPVRAATVVVVVAAAVEVAVVVVVAAGDIDQPRPSQNQEAPAEGLLDELFVDGRPSTMDRCPVRAPLDQGACLMQSDRHHKLRSPYLLDPLRKRCPVCHQSVYCRAGIHPQCAMKQDDTPPISKTTAVDALIHLGTEAVATVPESSS